MKKGALLILILSVCLYLPGQNTPQDCLGALPLCSNGLSVPLLGFHNYGNIQDLDIPNSCLLNGENNSVWYKFSIVDSGLLAFDIIPVGTDDYDFALYNLTNNSCQDILNGTLPPVRCNFSATNGTTTGMRPNYVTTSAGVSGDAFLAPLQVAPNESFALLVDNYTNNGLGYTINFDSSTTTLSDTGGITNVYADSAGFYNMNYTTVFFTQPLICNSILPNGSQFQINGPVAVNVDSIDVGCNGVTQEVVLYFNPSITVPDDYTIDIIAGTNGAMLTNVCGVTLGFSDIDFMVNTVVNVGYTYSINKQSSNTVTFINTTTFNSRINTTLSHYEWDFGDGTLSNDENPVHTFNGHHLSPLRCRPLHQKGRGLPTLKPLPRVLLMALRQSTA